MSDFGVCKLKRKMSSVFMKSWRTDGKRQKLEAVAIHVHPAVNSHFKDTPSLDGRFFR